MTAAPASDVANPTDAPLRRQLPGWKVVVLGVLAGVLWGTAARLWMRSISTSPEFTWAGTLFIIAIATVVGTGLAASLACRRRQGTRRARWAGAIGTLGILPLGAGAGVVMLPPIVYGAFALPGPVPRARTRVLLALFPMLGPVVIGLGGEAVLWLAVAAIALVLGLMNRGTFRTTATIAAAATALATLVPFFDGSLPVWRAALGSVGYLLLLSPVAVAYRLAVRGRTTSLTFPATTVDG